MSTKPDPKPDAPIALPAQLLDFSLPADEIRRTRQTRKNQTLRPKPG